MKPEWVKIHEESEKLLGIDYAKAESTVAAFYAEYPQVAQFWHAQCFNKGINKLPDGATMIPLHKLPAEIEGMSVKDMIQAVDAGEIDMSELSAKSKEFFKKLANDFKAEGKLSFKQVWWLKYIYACALGLDTEAKPQWVAASMSAPPAEKVDLGDMAGLTHMFSLAKGKLKYPAIVLKTNFGDVKLSVAGSTSKYAGQIQVTDGKPFGQNVWYGVINDLGQWKVSNKLSEDQVKGVERVLKGLVKDPLTTVQKSAHMSGKCCFCNTPLTHDKSTAVGFGPTCAANYGMTAQWKAAKPLTELFAVKEAA